MDASLDTIKASDAQDSLRTIRSIFDGEPGAARDVVLLNSGAALYACERAETLDDGVQAAARCIDSGEAGRRLDALVSLSQSLKSSAD